jgi:formylglycine-generating enzyme required for sulfatase activity
MIEIAGGVYKIGSEEGNDDEKPVHRVELAAFELAQFPVTNAEWKLFMEAGGYDDERWWVTEEDKAWQSGKSTSEGSKQSFRETRQFVQKNYDRLPEYNFTSQAIKNWQDYGDMTDEEFEVLLDTKFPDGRQKQPRYWNDNVYNNPAQPVVGICWYEARAYCAWLSMQTRQNYRLPSEAEWEAAARGLAGRRYAYGNEFDAALCNTFETHIRRTTPTGVFPDGDTPEGLIDMTGNTWDWTSSLYQPYPYRADDGRENPESDERLGRVLRGGAWSNALIYTRAGDRHYNRAGYRNNFASFRLSRASPIKNSWNSVH